MRAVVAKYLSPIKDALDDLTDILHGDHVNDDDELETALGWTRFQPDTSSFDADRVIGLPQLEHSPPPFDADAAIGLRELECIEPPPAKKRRPLLLDIAADRRFPAGAGNRNRGDIEVWDERCHRSIIARDQEKFKCKCGCVERMRLGVVFECRVRNADSTSVQRRDSTMQRLRHFYKSDTDNWAFEDDTGTPCCRKGWCFQEGHPESYVSRAISDFHQGNFNRNPAHGGARAAGTTGADPESDSSSFKFCFSWFSFRLPAWVDKDPEGGQLQVDKMTEDELYELFRMDCLDLDGLTLEEVPTMVQWKDVWVANFTNITIREIKTVDSKDKVREQLRQLMRNPGAAPRRRRLYLRGVLYEYRLAIRAERAAYWKAIIEANDNPETRIDFITDGASSQQFGCPGGINGFDSQHECLDLKFVATKFHGPGETQLVVIHLVIAALLSDNANLMQQLMINSLRHYSEMRAEKAGAPPSGSFLPAHARLQVDGVSTNWGWLTLSFITFLVMCGLFVSFEMARHPVGNTHEDIDQLFSIIRRYLQGKTWRTMDEYIALVRAALSSYRGKVVVEIVTDTLDFQSWLEPVSNKQLALYSRHGPSNYHPGMHVVRCDRGAAPGSVTVKFRQYNQPLFAHVVFSRREWAYWMCVAEDAPGAPEAAGLPAIVLIKSEWEEHTVLRAPPGSSRPLVLAERKDDWESGLALALRQSRQDLQGDGAAIATAERLIGTPGGRLGGAGATGLHIRASVSELWPGWLATAPADAAATAAAAAAALPDNEIRLAAIRAAVTAPYGPTMRSGAGEAAPLRRVVREIPVLSPLLAASFVLVKIESEDHGGAEFPLGLCVVQLPATFPVGFNSQDPAAVIKVKWWRPQKADGGYSAKWVLWLNGSRIWESNVQRGSIALTGLVLWAGSNDASKPIRGRWLKLTAASARAAADLDAR